MSAKIEVPAVIIGTTLAAGPAVLEKVPFYESTAWLSAVAVLGGFVLLVTAVNSGINLSKRLKVWLKER